MDILFLVILSGLQVVVLHLTLERFDLLLFLFVCALSVLELLIPLFQKLGDLLVSPGLLLDMKAK